MLTPALLDELQDALRRRDAAVADRWRPPRDASNVTGRIAELGLSLPAELAVWWGWHDGVENARQRVIGLAWWPLSIDDAVQATTMQRTMTEVEPDMPSWSGSWIEICFDGSRGALACEADVKPGEPSPVYVYYADDVLPERPAVASLGELVRFWIDAMHDGTLRIDE